MKGISVLSIILFALSAHLRAQEMPKDYQEVLAYLDRKGDYREEVLKVNLPRNDLKVLLLVLKPRQDSALEVGSRWKKGTKARTS